MYFGDTPETYLKISKIRIRTKALLKKEEYTR